MVRLILLLLSKRILLDSVQRLVCLPWVVGNRLRAVLLRWYQVWQCTRWIDRLLVVSDDEVWLLFAMACASILVLPR